MKELGRVIKPDTTDSLSEDISTSSGGARESFYCRASKYMYM